MRTTFGNVFAFLLLMALVPACPTVDLGDNPPEPGICRPDRSYFISTIWPQYIAPEAPMRSCVAQAGCHRLNDGSSSLRLEVDPGNPEAVDLGGAYDVVTRFLNCGVPESSPLLTKPLVGVDSHAGGDFIDPNDPNDPQYSVFLEWFRME